MCEEALDLLDRNRLRREVVATLEQMSPEYQVRAAKAMVTAGNYSARYAWALLAATPPEGLAAGNAHRRIGDLTLAAQTWLETQIARIRYDHRPAEPSFGDDVLRLIVARSYVAKVIGNTALESYLSQHHAVLLRELRLIVSEARLP